MARWSSAVVAVLFSATLAGCLGDGAPAAEGQPPRSSVEVDQECPDVDLRNVANETRGQVRFHDNFTVLLPGHLGRRDDPAAYRFLLPCNAISVDITLDWDNANLDNEWLFRVSGCPSAGSAEVEGPPPLVIRFELDQFHQQALCWVGAFAPTRSVAFEIEQRFAWEANVTAVVAP